MSEENRPNWWPENPYPETVFPMHLDEYIEIVPDPRARTAVSGCLGREFWGIASKTIYDYYKKYSKAEIERKTTAWLDAIRKLRAKNSKLRRTEKAKRDLLQQRIAELEKASVATERKPSAASERGRGG